MTLCAARGCSSSALPGLTLCAFDQHMARRGYPPPLRRPAPPPARPVVLDRALAPPPRESTPIAAALRAELQHDDRCESELVGPGLTTPCGCADRRLLGTGCPGCLYETRAHELGCEHAEGCPAGDEDCLSADDESHEACEPARLVPPALTAAQRAVRDEVLAQGYSQAHAERMARILC